jgi:hypothetical protein
MFEVPGGKGLESKEQMEGRLMADHILTRLLKVAEAHPFLVENQTFQSLVISLQVEAGEPSDETLKNLEAHDFPAIVQLLTAIDEAHEGVPVIGGAEVVVKTRGLFFESFASMAQEFSRGYKKEEAINAVESAAEAIIMGETEAGIKGLALRFQAMVRAAIFEDLLVIDDMEESMGSNFLYLDAGEDEVLEMLQRSSPQLEEINHTQGIDYVVSRIILEARDNIDNMKGSPMAQSVRLQIRNRAYQMLQKDEALLEDERPTFDEAVSVLGIPEAQALLMRGQLRGAKGEGSVGERKAEPRRSLYVSGKPGGPDGQITTLEELERRALARIPLFGKRPTSDEEN